MLSYQLSSDTPVLPRGEMGYEIIIVMMPIKNTGESVKVSGTILFYKADKYERSE